MKHQVIKVITVAPGSFLKNDKYYGFVYKGNHIIKDNYIFPTNKATKLIMEKSVILKGIQIGVMIDFTKRINWRIISEETLKEPEHLHIKRFDFYLKRC